MKKPYEKPVIFFENFTLSTSIAGDCETIVDNQSKGICGYKPSRLPAVFLEEVTGCVYKVPDDGSQLAQNGNTLCYHVPVSNMTLFNS